MFRIDNSTRVPALPTIPVAATGGYFTNGDPNTGLPATIVDAWWLNMVQEEILTVVSRAGLAANKTDNTQLWQAIQLMLGTLTPPPPVTNLIGQQATYKTPGVFTFNVPSGVSQLDVEVWGAGGGGGASGDGSGGGIPGNPGGGGGAGGYARRLIGGLTPGAAITVTVGGPGVGQPYNYGTAGGTSSFGPYLSATGGAGGNYGIASVGPGSAGGNGSGGDINVPGGPGGATGPNDFNYNANYLFDKFTVGGIAPLGMGTVAWSGTGGSATGYCGGAQGASGGAGLQGGNGAPGLIRIRW